MSQEANLEAYRQDCENLRHYSKLRFTVLSTFILISGAFFTLALREGSSAGIKFVLPCVAGIVIAIIFGLLEWRINQGLESMVRKVDALATELGMSQLAASQPPRSPFTKALAPLMMWVIYGGAIVMWIAAAIAKA